LLKITLNHKIISLNRSEKIIKIILWPSQHLHHFLESNIYALEAPQKQILSMPLKHKLIRRICRASNAAKNPRFFIQPDLKVDICIQKDFPQLSSPKYDLKLYALTAPAPLKGIFGPTLGRY
jgi:hypothetical protein